MRARQTSIEAFHEIKANGLLSERRFQVYECLFESGPLTQNECHQLISSDNMITKQSIGPRFAELERVGVITEVGKRVCSVTGKNCIIWDVTKKLPLKLDKPKKVKCPTCNGKGHTAEQQTRMF